MPTNWDDLPDDEDVSVTENFEGLPDNGDPEETKLALTEVFAQADRIAMAIKERYAAECERITGERPVPAAPSPLDMMFPELQFSAHNAIAFLKAFEVIKQWMTPGGTRSLGNVMKTIPQDDADEITRWLTLSAGYRPGPRYIGDTEG